MRTVDRSEGLALAGRATVGPLSLVVPSVLSAASETPLPGGAYVASEPAPAGQRRIVLGEGAHRFLLDLPVLAPEIVPPGGGVFPAGNGAALLHAPCDRAALRELRGSRPELVVLGNARALWSDGEPFVAAIHEIRTELGAEPLLWAPRVALPHRLALLTYLGIDLVDSTEGELRATAGEFLDPVLGARSLSAAEDRGCDCVACARVPAGSLVEHARIAYARAERELRAAIRRGGLRELVEARIAAEPALAEMLRYADRSLASVLEARTPVTAEGSRTYVLAEATRRPEMRRFRDRLVERYRPPPLKSVLLVVPCSRTKPYRRSPSHRRIARAYEELRGTERIHVVSVSSPIGVVPRELEDVPPARHYDIPVTGEWSQEEQSLVVRGLTHLLRQGQYQRVVLHLDPEEYDFVFGAVDALGAPSSRTCEDGRTTSEPSLARLRAALASALEAAPPTSGGPLAVVAQELREVASVQFGRVGADRLFAPPLRLMGRPWFQRITDGRQDLASLREERGLFHLTVPGALRIGDALPVVEADPGVSLEGDLFAPGVVRADPSIRVGDAVGVVRSGALAAVGEAAMAGPLLGDLRRGVAVYVRHRRHDAGDTAKTAPPSPDGGR